MPPHHHHCQSFPSQYASSSSSQVQYGNGTHDFAHLHIFEALPVYGGQIELKGYQLGHTRTDPLNYF